MQEIVERLDRIEARLAARQRAYLPVAEAAEFANESPFPDLEELFTDVYISYPHQKLNAGAAPEAIGAGTAFTPAEGSRSG